MARPMTTVSQQVTTNVKIYFDLIVQSKVSDPKTKALLTSMSGVVVQLVTLMVESVESGGKVDRAFAVKFAVGLVNEQFKIIDSDKVACATSLVDLALTAEAAFATGTLAIGANAVPVAGNTVFVLLMTYNACAVLSSALSTYQSCFQPKVATLQLIHVRSEEYLGRQAIA